MVLENPEADFQAFNVGGGKAWTVRQFYDTMQDLVGKQLPPKIEGAYRFGDTRHIFSDTSRLKRLGWSPKRDVANSIEVYWDWLTTQRQKEDILAYAERQMRRLNVIRTVRDKQ
jgi:dTDP-L-rhamnose 4-epimerase